MSKHIYVLDTCVLLHDPQCIHKFGEHDLHIPLACIDDLDDQKTRPELVGWSAREVFRVLEQFDIAELTGKGVVVNDQGGRLFVFNAEMPEKGQEPNISRVNSDNEIIKAAAHLKGKNARRRVIVVTRDMALRVRVISWGFECEGYNADLFGGEHYTGIRHVDVDNSADWDALWASISLSPTELSSPLQAKIADLYPNEFVIFHFGQQACPAHFKNKELHTLKEKSNGIEKGKKSYMGVTAQNLEQRCALEVLGDDNVPLVTLCGAAGTGKTMLSIAVALDKIMHGMHEKLIVIKPLVPVGGKDIGFLPGDKFEKIAAWMGPMRDNIEQLVTVRKQDGKASGGCFEEMVEDGLIEVEAMAFIQGRSVTNAIIIIDEAQNLSPKEARMAVERCGKNSRIFMLGDMSQVENKSNNRTNNGLAHAVQGGRPFDKVASITLTKVERSDLAAIAGEIFAQPEAQR